MADKSLRAVRKDGRNPAVVWVLAAVAVVLIGAISYLIFAGGIFDSEPQTDLERDYQMLLEGLQENPENAALLMTLAEVEYQLGKTADAFARAEKAVEIEPENPAMLVRYSQLLVQEGRFEDARVNLVTVTEIDGGGSPEPYFILAQIDREEGDLDSAIVYMERGLEISPTSADIRVLYAEILEEAGMTDEAIAQYQEALRFLPDDPVIIEALGRLGVSVEASETPVAPHGDQ